MRKKPTRKRPYFMMESAMTAILRDASGKMHHGILFARRLGGPLELSILSLTSKELGSAQKKNHFVFAVSVRTKQRLWKNEPLSFCYWHEFLDLVYVFR